MFFRQSLDNFYKYLTTVLFYYFICVIYTLKRILIVLIHNIRHEIYFGGTNFQLGH